MLKLWHTHKIDTKFGFWILGTFTTYARLHDVGASNSVKYGLRFCLWHVLAVCSLGLVHLWLCFRNENFVFLPPSPPAALHPFVWYHDGPMARKRVIERVCWGGRCFQDKSLQGEDIAVVNLFYPLPQFHLLPDRNVSVLSVIPATLLGSEANWRMNVKYIGWQSWKRKSMSPPWHFIGFVQAMGCLLLNTFNLWMKFVSILFTLIVN